MLNQACCPLPLLQGAVFRGGCRGASPLRSTALVDVVGVSIFRLISMYNGSDSNTSAHVVGGSAHVVCTLVRVERMVLLQSLTSVPLPVWPLPDTELLPCIPP